MKLVWKCGRLSSISFLKSSIPFHSGIFHIPYRNFRSIPFSISYHATGCSQIENPEAPDFEKIASASGSFSTLSLPLPTSFIKVLSLPQKINRFQLPLPHPCMHVLRLNFTGFRLHIAYMLLLRSTRLVVFPFFAFFHKSRE